jgi:hypothetical protein
MKLYCLIDEWKPLCLIKACKYGLWLGNDLIPRIEGPDHILISAKRKEIERLGILMQLIKIVWDHSYMNVNRWENGRKF